jgi:hypothetical protein
MFLSESLPLLEKRQPPSHRSLLVNWASLPECISIVNTMPPVTRSRSRAITSALKSQAKVGAPKREEDESKAHGGVPATVPVAPAPKDLSSIAKFCRTLDSIVSSHYTHALSQFPQQRLLWSAAERKTTVVAVGALRVQISLFKEEFVRLYGSPPKCAAEQAPLAKRYKQHRQWKRVVRGGAACHIQAHFRGARTRWRLRRTQDPRAVHVVRSRAGRAQECTAVASSSSRSTHDHLVNQLSIPVEISEETATPSPLGTSSVLPMAPQWTSKVVHQQLTSGGSATENYATSVPLLPCPNGAPVPLAFQGAPPAVAATSETGSLKELQARKHELKQQLKQYDMRFARQHGRMPVNAEKEPIRHLYERYKALKSQIMRMEQGECSASQASAASSPSPPDHGTAFTSDHDCRSTGTRGPLLSNSRHEVRRASSPSPPPLVASHSGSSNDLISAVGSSPTSAASSLPDLAALNAARRQLHQILQSYEKSFFKEHRRQVSCFADIRPVASQYRRYKEIKKAIAALQAKQQEQSVQVTSGALLPNTRHVVRQASSPSPLPLAASPSGPSIELVSSIDSSLSIQSTATATCLSPVSALNAAFMKVLQGPTNP